MSMTQSATNCLKVECCAGTTVGDLFKLAVPAGWSFVALLASLAYLISPLQRGGKFKTKNSEFVRSMLTCPTANALVTTI